MSLPRATKDGHYTYYNRMAYRIEKHLSDGARCDAWADAVWIDINRDESVKDIMALKRLFPQIIFGKLKVTSKNWGGGGLRITLTGLQSARERGRHRLRLAVAHLTKQLERAEQEETHVDLPTIQG